MRIELRTFVAHGVVAVTGAIVTVSASCRPDLDNGPFLGRTCASDETCPPYLVCVEGRCHDRCDPARSDGAECAGVEGNGRCKGGGCIPNPPDESTSSSGATSSASSSSSSSSGGGSKDAAADARNDADVRASTCDPFNNDCCSGVDTSCCCKRKDFMECGSSKADGTVYPKPQCVPCGTLNELCCTQRVPECDIGLTCQGANPMCMP